ncbi:MAG: undecaprenyl-diphosphate phosphatase [Candidatus Sabulitectum sp.]|nr:undecaprenyl-diphosphate phosphatase [Candidatus Sabulitectum sp.]
MSPLEASILAVVQGLTEFLPVSSSGHLAMASNLLSVPEGGLAFDIVLHLGTLVAVFVFYWKDIVSLLRGIFLRERKSLLLGLALVVGTIPVAIAGFLSGDLIEALRTNMFFISCALAFTGTILFFSGKIPVTAEPGITFKRGVLVGLAQTLAILPGVSRSGTTICTGLFVGLSREEAARFSFLLAIPAILGAAVKELPSASWDIPAGNILIGFAVSAVVGFGALSLLVKFVKQGKLTGFAWYCWTIALAGLAFSLQGAV